MGEAVILPGIVSGDRVTCALGQLPLAIAIPDGMADVLVRPEQIRLTQEGAIRALVRQIVFYGHDASVTLALDGLDPEVTARLSGHMVPQPGDRVALAVEGPVMAYATACGKD